jgi:hypothetical protein
VHIGEDDEIEDDEEAAASKAGEAGEAVTASKAVKASKAVSAAAAAEAVSAALEGEEGGASGHEKKRGEEQGAGHQSGTETGHMRQTYTRGQLASTNADSNATELVTATAFWSCAIGLRLPRCEIKSHEEGC